MKHLYIIATEEIETPLNHWLFGNELNKKCLHYIASNALGSGKATAVLPLQNAFGDILVKADNQATFIAAIAEELEKLQLFRMSKLNRFKRISYKLTKSNLAEGFAIALLKGKSHEEATQFLELAIKGKDKNYEYNNLVLGVSYEYQKKVLMSLRKRENKGWQ
jgi:hypothetical protein